MPRRKKRKVVPTSRVRTSTSGHVAPNRPAGTSDYRHFLNSYVVTPGDNDLRQSSVDRWFDSNDLDAGDHPDRGEIVNEVAKKFNDNNTLGIPQFTYKPGGKGSYYHIDDQHPNLDLLARHHMYQGPNPITTAHELMHANDHQSNLPQDRLTPKMWERLRALATTGGGGGNSINSFPDFITAVGKIQEKLHPIFESAYKLDTPYIEKEISAADGLGGAANYNIPTTPANAPDWISLFNKINDVVTYTPPPLAAGAPAVQNPQFYLNFASEFPAYMMERLTERWNTRDIQADGSQGADALSEDEAKTLYHMAGDTGDSYTAADAPVMNRRLHERRNSIFGAFNPVEFAAEQAAIAGGVPPAPRPAEWLSHGGRVTGKNLLSRFIKPKRKAS